MHATRNRNSLTRKQKKLTVRGWTMRKVIGGEVGEGKIDSRENCAVKKTLIEIAIHAAPFQTSQEKKNHGTAGGARDFAEKMLAWEI